MDDKFSVSNAPDAKEQATQAISQAVEQRLADLDKATEVSMEKLDIKDGDVYVVKCTGDDFDEATIVNFKKSLKGKFPKVEFIVLALPVGSDVKFQKLAATEVKK